jgi:hypothetical protein
MPAGGTVSGQLPRRVRGQRPDQRELRGAAHREPAGAGDPDGEARPPRSTGCRRRAVRTPERAVTIAGHRPVTGAAEPLIAVSGAQRGIAALLHPGKHRGKHAEAAAAGNIRLDRAPQDQPAHRLRSALDSVECPPRPCSRRRSGPASQEVEDPRLGLIKRESLLTSLSLSESPIWPIVVQSPRAQVATRRDLS